MLDEWLEWDEILALQGYEIPMELPEDLLFYFAKKNPYLLELMETHSLEIEY